MSPQLGNQKEMIKSAFVLGSAGLIPFILLPLASWMSWFTSDYLNHLFIGYSAVILSFFGGVHWLDALRKEQTTRQLYIAMLPSIYAFIAFMLPTTVIALYWLALGYIAIFAYDLFKLVMPKWYVLLRTFLTISVVSSHALLIQIL